MKFTLIRVTADGEQMSVEFSPPGDDIKAHAQGITHIRKSREVAAALDLIDARLLECNNRIIASNYMMSKLSPEQRIAATSVIDTLAGRSPGAPPEEIVKIAKAERDAEVARIQEREQAAKLREQLADEGAVEDIAEDAHVGATL